MNRQQLYGLTIAALLALAAVGCGGQEADSGGESTTQDSVSSRDDLIGTWRLTETSSRFQKHTYNLEITAGSSSDEIVITDRKGKFKGTVNGHSFTIPQVSVDDAMYSASGTLDGKRLTYKSALTERDVERHSSGILLSDGTDITYTGTGTRVDTSVVDPAREKYIDTWVIVQEGKSSQDSYELTIKPGSGGREIILKNLTNVEAPVDRGRKGIRIGYPTEEEIFATIDNHTITIPQQSNEGTEYSGSGTLDGNTISLKFTRNDDRPKRWNAAGRRKGIALPATRDDYLGTWKGFRYGRLVEISAGTNENEIVIKDFCKVGYTDTTVTALIDGNKFTVEHQVDHRDFPHGITISGSGTVSGTTHLDTINYESTVTFNYTGGRTSKDKKQFEGGKL